jgi:hypothetical protein
MILPFVLSAILGLLVAVSVDRQLPFRGGRILTFGVATALATAAASVLTGAIGLPGLAGGAAGAVAGLLLGRRPD